MLITNQHGSILNMRATQRLSSIAERVNDFMFTTSRHMIGRKLQSQLVLESNKPIATFCGSTTRARYQLSRPVRFLAI
jgi:hypothetical protein